MKSLAQVEPRTPISSLPFNITSSGSYYVAANLTGVSGQSGITITADNVTLDLEGFALVGTAGSLHGVTVAAGKQNIVVYNGILRGWGGNGLDAGGALNCRVEKLLAVNNTGHGLAVGANGAISACQALVNNGDGVRVSSSCVVLNNSCNTNGAGPGTAGIHATGDNNRIEGNHLSGNLACGIQVDGSANLVVKNSAAYSGTTDYNIAANSSYGQLVQAPGPSFTNATAWANFSSSCPNGQSFCSGVCIALSSNPNNCGTCGNVCSFPNATAGCNNGVCVLATCNAGYADCNNNPADGCELSVATDVNNCGGCGVVCGPFPNATAGCVNEKCVIGACNPGYANCDGLAVNGCEVNLLTSANNCGSCGTVCNLPNATANCVNGACTIASCNLGYGDCDGIPANGCEASLVSTLNCGACGVVCPGGPNSISYCSGGMCHFTCTGGYFDCNNNPFDGCEVNTLTDVNNCGACGHSCGTVPNGVPSCSNGTCVIASCNPGYNDCNNSVTDGCEVNTANDVNNCGACGISCGTVPNGVSGCSNSTCVIASCNPGYGDCDNVRINGCEANLNTDNSHCGSCGNVCNPTTQQCTSGVCKLNSGQPCTSNGQCISGACNANVCS
jgi:hypothetical protein